MPLEITNPMPEELEDTLRLAFAHVPDMERAFRIEGILAQFHAGTLSLEGIFQAKDGEHRVGALFSQIRSDGTVMLWTPTAIRSASVEPFFEPLERFCRANDVLAAIALVDLGQSPQKSALLEAKFEYLSDLLYLVLPLAETEEGPPKRELRFLPMNEVGPEAFDRMVETVKITYKNTRDFPRLLHLLPVRNVLEGYRDNAPFHPELWFFVQKDGRNVGALLLSLQPDDQIELTYMGLAEEVRGSGHGREIVRFAVQEARRRHLAYLLTSVDDRNAAALRSYLTQGFRAWDRKNVYARFFD